ncbi:MAG: deoxyribonuclease IV [Nitrospirae bacterium]|nr:deoxyribonuclease IV [Nitrospirota bacterium]
MKRRIGIHTSIAGGIDKALERARYLDCSTVQIFSHNPRGWQVANRNAVEIKRFRDLKRQFEIFPVYIHTSYLVNLAAKQKDLHRKSIDMMVQEMEIADIFGAEYVVLHTGSAAGEEARSARKRSVEALKLISERGTWKAGLLLENTAGERGDITSRIVEIAEIIDQAPPGLVSGICLDTCHAFSAGYNFAQEEGIDALATEIRIYLGQDKLRLIHLNDSRRPMGSGVDRHEHIGKGTIGSKGLKRFLQHPFFCGIPLILETPKKTDADDVLNLRAVRQLIRG